MSLLFCCHARWRTFWQSFRAIETLLVKKRKYRAHNIYHFTMKKLDVILYAVKLYMDDI